MKTIKADLSNEGRMDILGMVRSYRGGKAHFRMENPSALTLLVTRIHSRGMELKFP